MAEGKTKKYLTKRERELAERRADVEAGGVGSRATGVWRKGESPADRVRKRREQLLQAAASGKLGPEKQLKARKHIADRKEDSSSPFYDPAPFVSLTEQGTKVKTQSKAKGGLVKKSKKKSKKKPKKKSIDGIARKGKTKGKHR